MNYRIYWPDLKDYSIHESFYPERLIQHGIACAAPFEIRRGDEVVASWTPEEGLVWSEAYKSMPLSPDLSEGYKHWYMDQQIAYQRVAG